MYKNFNLTEEERKEILKQHGKFEYKKSLKETFDDIFDKDKLEKDEPSPRFESADELLVSIKDRLTNALQMKEWSLVEEVCNDMMSYMKNDMDNSSEDDGDMPGFEGTKDSMDFMNIR
jgi:hypothetical protein